MKQEHPITPPLELVNQWLQDGPEYYDLDLLKYVATQAARWGADQELEACCEWLEDPDLNVDTYKLCAARRPKPPSLKEQALEDFDGLMSELDGAGNYSNCAERIRRALDALPDD